MPFEAIASKPHPKNSAKINIFVVDQCRFVLIIDQVLKADISFCGFESMNVFSGPKEGPVLQFGKLVLKAGVLCAYCTVIEGIISIYLKPFPVSYKLSFIYERVDFVFLDLKEKIPQLVTLKSSVLDILPNIVF